MVNRWAACPLPCTEQVQCGAVVVYNALTQKRWEVNASQETLFSDPSIFSWKERQLFSSIKKTVEESQRRRKICQKLKKFQQKTQKVTEILRSEVRKFVFYASVCDKYLYFECWVEEKKVSKINRYGFFVLTVL